MASSALVILSLLHISVTIKNNCSYIFQLQLQSIQKLADISQCGTSQLCIHSQLVTTVAFAKICSQLASYKYNCHYQLPILHESAMLKMGQYMDYKIQFTSLVSRYSDIAIALYSSTVATVYITWFWSMDIPYS